MLVLLWLAAATAGAETVVRADDGAVTLQPRGQEINTGADAFAAPMDQWLEEVKAQRRAWEERRRAAKEAINTRRRLSDPWGAAQQDAREKDLQRRHDAMVEQFERDRETFRNQVLWPNSPSPRDPGPPPGAGQPARSVDASAAPQERDGAPPAPGSTAQNPGNPGAYPPSGWDNRWYYRGY